MKNAFQIAGLCVPSGTVISQEITVANENYSIPITVINGENDGKVFLASAGIHGCEYPGIVSLVELGKEIKPQEVSGAVVLLPVINPSSFYGRIPYICAVDEERKNFNRLFPGNKNGTLADRVAVWLMDEIVDKCDFHVDIHSGDIVESLEEFVAVCNSPDPEVKEYASEAAKHTCFTDRINSGGREEFYNASAIVKKKPSLLFERGGRGVWSREEADRNKYDLISIMQFMKILPGVPRKNETQGFYDKHHWGEAEHTGLFYKFVDTGSDVKKGEKIGEIRDIRGNVLEAIYAEFDGHIKISPSTLGISSGDDTFMYGRIDH